MKNLCVAFLLTWCLGSGFDTILSSTTAKFNKTRIAPIASRYHAFCSLMHLNRCTLTMKYRACGNCRVSSVNINILLGPGPPVATSLSPLLYCLNP